MKKGFILVACVAAFACACQQNNTKKMDKQEQPSNDQQKKQSGGCCEAPKQEPAKQEQTVSTPEVKIEKAQ